MEKVLRWNELKNARLKRARGASFQEVLSGDFLQTIEHPSRTGQKIMLFRYRREVWAVPFVENEDEIFLKTTYPCRKYRKMFGGE
ncbi:MAG: toxin [Candidatus Omnitrophica bacterium]|nr:toxin [Candidatus Omnitrophota bacterium]